MAATVTQTRRGWIWFIAWLAVGACYVLGLLGAFTIGPFAVAIAVVATIALVTRRQAIHGLPGLITGLGLPLLYVAYLNRSGPGIVCSSDALSRSCIEEWSPWPWLALGGILLLGGPCLFTLINRRQSGRENRTSNSG